MSESEVVSAHAGNGAFDSEVVEGLARAFELAWAKVEASGLLGAEVDPAAVRETLAKRIVEAAKNGERDHEQLAADALRHLAERGAMTGGAAEESLG